jgi:hypothetical protein
VVRIGWLAVGLWTGCQAPCEDPAACDVDEDGVVAADDCDDTDASVGRAATWRGDCDADGVAGDVTTDACERPTTSPCDSAEGVWLALDQPDGDCDDEDAATITPTVWYADCDGDGRHSDATPESCGPPDAWCDGAPPEGGFTDVAPPVFDCDDRDAARDVAKVWYPDCDGDGADGEGTDPSCGPPDAWCDNAPPAGGWTDAPPTDFDCDDADATYAVSAVWYPDCDGDGDPADQGPLACAPPDDWCDNAPPTGGWTDTAPAIGDCDDADGALSLVKTWYADCDGDGVGAATGPTSCGPPSDWCDGAPPAGGWSDAPPTDVDCDDDDNGQGGAVEWFPDCDGDGAFSMDGTVSCTAPVGVCAGAEPLGGFVNSGATGDCDDTDAGEQIVETWIVDCDGDDVPGLPRRLSCGEPTLPCSGVAAVGNVDVEPDPPLRPEDFDCDDTDRFTDTVRDYAVDCDVDGFFADTAVSSCGDPTAADCGGFGTPTSTLFATGTPKGDCNDRNGAISPGDLEVCGDGLDNDCAGGDRVCPPPTETINITASSLKLIGAQAGDEVGYGFFSGVPIVVRDLDNDGNADVVVGSPDPVNKSHSKIHVVYGPVTADVDLASVTTRIDGVPGFCVGSRLRVGDIDADGGPDIVSHEWCHIRNVLGTNYEVGRILAYSGLPAAPVTADNNVAEILPPTAGTAGRRISFDLEIGNLVGDSADDLVVQSSRTASSVGTAGDVWVLQGPLDGVTQLPDLGHFTGQRSSDVFGESFVIDSTDADGNGYDTLYVSGVHSDADTVDNDWYGAVLRFDGPLDLTPGVAYTKASDARFGAHRCARAGMALDLADVTGDGDLDLLVSAQQSLTTFPATGSCGNITAPGHSFFLDPDFRGKQGVAGQLAGRTLVANGIVPNQEGPHGIGDFNGDGVGDFAVTDIVSTPFQVITIYIFLGPWDHDLTATDARYRITSSTYSLQFFTSGDVTGDGRSDLLLPTSSYPNTTDRRGAVFIVPGRP